MTSGRGCEYRVNSTGPMTYPWGTPKTRGIGVDIKPSTTTDCVLSFRYDSNQDSATPEIPKVLSSRLNRMARSRVSKAALRSNSASIDTSFWSDFVRRPSSTLKTAVSVLWYFLYADCRISSKLFAHRWDCSWRTTLSSIFKTNGRFETGLKFLKSLASRPGFFSMGVTRACFNPDGTVTVDKETLTILVTRGARSCRHRLVRVVGIGSRMQLFVGDWEMSLQISASVTGSNVDNSVRLGLELKKGRWVMVTRRVKVFTDLLNHGHEKVTKTLWQVCNGNVRWQRGSLCFAEQFVRHSKKLLSQVEQMSNCCWNSS